MAKARVLAQLDPDAHASLFDAVVAVDAGVEHLLQYQCVTPESVTGLVHGAIFTRGLADLKSTAIFIGGADLTAGEALLNQIQKTFFGPMRVSVMLDSNGANTTAAAAVMCACRHWDRSDGQAVVLGATGPVGQRVSRLLAKMGIAVAMVSRDASKANAAIERLTAFGLDRQLLKAVSATDAFGFGRCLETADLLFSCGAAGVQMISPVFMSKATQLKVAVDLNAVAPAGIPEIEPFDTGKSRSTRLDYGAIGVGNLKMKIHKLALQKLFDSNDLVLDAEEIFELAKLI